MGHLLTILQKAISRLLFSDNFNRIDASTLGAPWVYYNVPSWSILSNKAYNTDTASVNALACYQALTPNVSISANITVGQVEGLAMRLSDGTNYITARISGAAMGLFRFVSGAATQLGTYTFNPVVGTTYAIKAICNGSTIRIFINGAEVITVANETFNLTQTLFGFRSTSNNVSTVGKFDDFLVEAL